MRLGTLSRVSASCAADRGPFFFVHVMKTGGTSFVLHLLANFAPDEVYPSEGDKRMPSDVEPYASVADLAAVTPERRARIRFFSGHLPFAARELIGPDVVTLSILRDPVERTVSVLKHFKRLFPRYRDATLDDVYDDAFIFRHFVENFQTRVFALTPEDEPQSFASRVSYRDIRAALDAPTERIPVPDASATIPIDERRLEIARTNLAQLDVLGVTDRFPAFVDALRARFGWWPNGLDVGARANVSSEDWDVRPSLRRRIVDDNAFDMELFRIASESAAGTRR